MFIYFSRVNIQDFSKCRLCKIAVWGKGLSNEKQYLYQFWPYFCIISIYYNDLSGFVWILMSLPPSKKRGFIVLLMLVGWAVHFRSLSWKPFITRSSYFTSWLIMITGVTRSRSQWQRMSKWFLLIFLNTINH